jgi:hypothetical protein
VNLCFEIKFDWVIKFKASYLMTDIEFLQEIDKQYLDIVAKYYPSLKVPSWGSSGPNFHFDLSNIYKHYNGSPYYYQKKLEFLHWTSVQNLFSIINNAELRLYNLWNSEDNSEFEYAAKLLSLAPKQINLIKERYYIASFCEKENLSSDYLWKIYGKNYSGVAIHFEIVNNIDDAENFIISNVYYRLPKEFKKFNDEVLELKAKYKNAFNFDFNNWRFAGFYKKKPYEQEKEIRLALIYPFRSEIDSLKFIRKELKLNKRRNRVVAYFPLKLWVDPDSSYFKTLEIENFKMINPFQYNHPSMPQLKIKTVYFGKNSLPNLEYGGLYNELREIINWKLGYDVELPLNTYP